MSREFFLRKMEEERIRVYQVRDGRDMLMENDELLGLLAKWSEIAKSRGPSPFCPKCYTIPCIC